MKSSQHPRLKIEAKVVYIHRVGLVICLFIFLITTCRSQISLPRLISEGAVFQRQAPVHIWGQAVDEEVIHLKFVGMEVQTKVGPSGRWDFILPAQEAGGPFEMEIYSNDETIHLEDIYFGDVWVCSGQSNMELTMERVKEKYPQKIAAGGNSLIRQFLVPDVYAFDTTYADVESGHWEPCTSESIQQFSAVGYFFAEELFRYANVPIGLINAALGGSRIESWMSETTLKEFPESYDELQKYKDPAFVKNTLDADRIRSQSWYEELNSKDKGIGQWAQIAVVDSAWMNVSIPGRWIDQGLGAQHGVAWFRRKIFVPKEMTGKPGLLWMGTIVDSDQTFINGVEVGNTTYQYPPRRYYFEGDRLKEGENVIVIRMVSSGNQGRFVQDKPYFLMVGKDTIDLRGVWKCKRGAEMPPLTPQTFVRWKPSGLHNRMMHPLFTYPVKGVLWYQGESNTRKYASYARAFSAMVTDWRRQWGIDDLPFLYVQLPNFMEAKPVPSESDWAEFRQQQLNALAIPNTGMVVAIDAGEWNDIHPLDKETIGLRLAGLAKDMVYLDDSVNGQSPIPDKARFTEQYVEVTFKNALEGLKLKKGKRVGEIAISSDGTHFVWASARIDGDRLIVWHDDIVDPVAVRYAWADNPENANLYARNGLPVSPFELRK